MPARKMWPHAFGHFTEFGIFADSVHCLHFAETSSSYQRRNDWDGHIVNSGLRVKWFAIFLSPIFDQISQCIETDIFQPEQPLAIPGSETNNRKVCFGRNDVQEFVTRNSRQHTVWILIGMSMMVLAKEAASQNVLHFERGSQVFLQDAILGPITHESDERMMVAQNVIPWNKLEDHNKEHMYIFFTVWLGSFVKGLLCKSFLKWNLFWEKCRINCFWSVTWSLGAFQKNHRFCRATLPWSVHSCSPERNKEQERTCTGVPMNIESWNNYSTGGFKFYPNTHNSKLRFIRSLFKTTSQSLFLCYSASLIQKLPLLSALSFRGRGLVFCFLLFWTIVSVSLMSHTVSEKNTQYWPQQRTGQAAWRRRCHHTAPSTSISSAQPSWGPVAWRPRGREVLWGLGVTW